MHRTEAEGIAVHVHRYCRDGALLRSFLEEVSYTENTKSRDTQFSTQKSTFYKHRQTDVVHLSACTVFVFNFYKLSQNLEKAD